MKTWQKLCVAVACVVVPSGCSESSKNPCDGATCSNHGTCEVISGGAVCNCEPGYVTHWSTYCVPEHPPGVCNKGNWCWQNPLPTGNDLTDVWVSEEGEVFVVGACGTILHRGSESWLELVSVTEYGFSGVWGADSADVWAVGSNGVIFHWNGSNWTNEESWTSEHLRDVWGVASDDLWAVGHDSDYDSGFILHRDGVAWSKYESTPLELDPLRGIWGSASDDVWAVGNEGYEHGAILHWDGSSWASAHSAGAAILPGIWGTASDDVWAVGWFFEADPYIRSVDIILHWDGSAWTEVPTDSENDLEAVFALDSTHAWAVGYFGTTLHWDGSAWLRWPSGNSGKLLGVSGLASND
ncbi:MAG: hypothetical protein JRJ19_03105, partial [Deltaproteobacteria bacterium]|nr:hypothetical protein [Deltaproteobacteria bacterium]